MSEREPSARDSFVDALVEAARSERPREGAKVRAFGALVPALSFAVAEAQEAPPSEPSKTWGRVVRTGWAVTILAACAGLLFLQHQRDQAAAVFAAQTAELAAQKAQVDTLLAALRAQTDAVAALQSTVASANDDAARTAAEAQLEEARQAQARTSAAVRAGLAPRAAGGSAAGGSAGGAAADHAKAACNCTPGDPLCSCIP